jgi:hypothetical protein
MALKFKWFVLLIALDSVATFGQIYESLERGATNYFISHTENDSDSYEHNALQIKYETFFAPSLVLFDGNNKVLYKIEYDENLLSKLGEFINTKLKG